jgi:hypothetical protein
MSGLTHLREHLRQLRYPAEFRIGVPVRPARPAGPPPGPEPGAVPAAAADLPDSVVADLATSLWRTRRKIEANGSTEPPRAQRAAGRHLLTAWETLHDAGVEIQDHDGMRFDPGLALDVVAYEPRPGTIGGTVLETVRPSVYRSGRCIQIGQVIVAQSEEGQGNGARDH